MTDRINSFRVILKEPRRVDEVRDMQLAISMISGVEAVEVGEKADWNYYTAARRAVQILETKVWEAFAELKREL